MKLATFALPFALVACKADSGASSPPAAAAEAPAVAAAGAKVGQVAPDFTVPDDSGTAFTLSSLRDESAVLLAFYPADFTGG